MTSPIFFIVSTNEGKLKSIVGAYCQDYLGGRPANPIERAAINERIFPSCTQSLRDALTEGTYATVRVFDARAAARAAAKNLNACNGCFVWVVVQLGKEQRDLSRKPKGYQIVYGPDAAPSAWNDHNDAALIDAGECPNLYVKTRAVARKRVADARGEDSGMGYRLRTLYA